MPSTVITPAIVLRSTLYGEADRVVSLLGKTTGRVSALARGARKSVRRFGGGLGLAATGEASLRERAGADLMVLESFDQTEARAELGADIARAAHAGYALELCERLCGPRQPEPQVFDWLEEFLLRLQTGGARIERLRVFELGLLNRLGIGPSLQACVACGRKDLGDEAARWHPERGGLMCRNCARHGSVLTAAVRKAMARMTDFSLADADGDKLTKDDNAGCREAILETLRVHITSPLKSLEFINKMGGA